MRGDDDTLDARGCLRFGAEQQPGEPVGSVEHHGVRVKAADRRLGLGDVSDARACERELSTRRACPGRRPGTRASVVRTLPVMPSSLVTHCLGTMRGMSVSLVCHLTAEQVC